jgi:hypothetical protein
MDRRTLGGSKKILFEPKWPQDDDVPIIDEVEEPQEKETREETNKPKRGKRNYVESMSALHSSKKSTVFVSGISEREKVYSAGAVDEDAKVDEPFLDDQVFGEDVLYLFSGMDIEGGKILVYENGTCEIKVGEKTYNLRPRHVENNIAVEMGDDVCEIGMLSTRYIIQRED